MSSFQRIVKYIGMAFAILLTLAIVGGVFATVFGITSAKSGKSKKNTTATSDVYDVGKFTSFKIKGGVADIEIKTGDGYKVETKDVPENTKVEVRSDGTLEITSKSKIEDWFNWFDASSWNMDSKIYVTVPEGFEAKDAIIAVGTGDVSIENIKADKLDIDGGVGDMKGSNITASEVDLDSGVGDINFSSVIFNDCDIDGGVGDVTIEGQITGENDIDGGVGELSLVIQGSRDDYDLDLEGGVGSVRLDDKTVKDYKQNGNGSNSLEVDGGVGSVSIQFQN